MCRLLISGLLTSTDKTQWLKQLKTYMVEILHRYHSIQDCFRGFHETEASETRDRSDVASCSAVDSLRLTCIDRSTFVTNEQTKKVGTLHGRQIQKGSSIIVFVRLSTPRPSFPFCP